MKTVTTRPQARPRWRFLYVRCQFYGCNLPGARRRQLTAYTDDRKNFAVLCPDHQAEREAYWEERWAEHYAGIM